MTVVLMLARFLERESANFWHIAIFRETNSSYAEFSGEKKEELVIGLTGARENHS
jgi:hypothetical protein